MKDRILVTGGAGFIGSNFIKQLLANSESLVFNLDKLTYAGNLDNLDSVQHHNNYKFIHGSIENKELVRNLCIENKITGIINFAAESHVDRSIIDSKPFIDTNILGTLNLLETARDLLIERFVQVSTDEVYGELGEEGKFTEESNICPNSPYSASKASADHFVMAYSRTFGINASITRCSNNYGPFQFPEKLIPLMIVNALNDIPLPVYGDGLNVRDWIHVEDHCDAIRVVYEKGKSGEVYNIGGNSERKNIEIVKLLLNILGKNESLITFVTDRLGHDRRYAIDSEKIQREMGWQAKVSFESGIKSTVDWYLNNRVWRERIKSGEYQRRTV